MGEPNRSEETKRKISETMTGITRSFETRRKMSLAQRGNQNWLDRHHTQETRDKISKNYTGSGNPMYGRIGENSSQWRGDKASYSAIHIWIRKHHPPPTNCMDCGVINNRLDLACVTGIYDRNIDNYRYICRFCHTKRDGHKHYKDMSDRICSMHGGSDTYVRRDGTLSWSNVDGMMLCGRCYNRYRRSKRENGG